jgi:hypothetical protein
VGTFRNSQGPTRCVTHFPSLSALATLQSLSITPIILLYCSCFTFATASFCRLFRTSLRRSLFHRTLETRLTDYTPARGRLFAKYSKTKCSPGFVTRRTFQSASFCERARNLFWSPSGGGIINYNAAAADVEMQKKSCR